MAGVDSAVSQSPVAPRVCVYFLVNATTRACSARCYRVLELPKRSTMAKNNRLRIVTLLFAFWALLPAIASGQNASRSARPAALDQGTLDLFAGYPENENLKLIIYTHARREPMEG